MNIKIVPVGSPNEEGHWITVERRTERFLKWPEISDLYAPDIPEGFVAVSFDRHQNAGF